MLTVMLLLSKILKAIFTSAAKTTLLTANMDADLSLINAILQNFISPNLVFNTAIGWNKIPITG